MYGIDENAPAIQPQAGGYAEPWIRQGMMGGDERGGVIPGVGGAIGGIMGLLNYFSPQNIDNRRLQAQEQAGFNEYIRNGSAPAASAGGGYNSLLKSQYPGQTQLAQNPLIQNYVRQNEDAQLHTQGLEDLQNYAQAHGLPAELAPEYYRGQVEQGLEGTRFSNQEAMAKIENDNKLAQLGLENTNQLGLEKQRESSEDARQNALINAENQRQTNLLDYDKTKGDFSILHDPLAMQLAGYNSDDIQNLIGDSSTGNQKQFAIDAQGPATRRSQTSDALSTLQTGIGNLVSQDKANAAVDPNTAAYLNFQGVPADQIGSVAGGFTPGESNYVAGAGELARIGLPFGNTSVDSNLNPLERMLMFPQGVVRSLVGAGQEAFGVGKPATPPTQSTNNNNSIIDNAKSALAKLNSGKDITSLTPDEKNAIAQLRQQRQGR